MANFQGNDGDVAWAKHETPGAALIRSWRMRLTYVTSEITAFADTVMRKNMAGMASMEGSMSGTLATGGALDFDNIDAGGSVMTLTVGTASTFGFTAIITGATVESSKVGDASVTFDFANGDGTFTETWT